MLICRQAGPGRHVWLTDDPKEARRLQQTEPVIGIAGPGPEYKLWSGVFYLAEDPDAADAAYCSRVWCRHYGVPAVILEGEGWCLRETDRKDIPGLEALYQDTQAVRYLEHPLGADPQQPDPDRTKKWTDWLDAYRRYVYRMDGPAMWTLTDGNDRFAGRLGLEWRREKAGGAGKETEGYFLGYALMPEMRGKGMIAAAGRELLCMVRKEWGIDTVYLVCEKENQASAKTAERLGFQPVRNRNDQACSLLIMSVSIPEIMDLT